MQAERTDQPLNGMLISDTAIKQPVFVTMLMLLAIVIGLIAYTTMPVNLLPDVDMPIVTVRVVYPGAGPESVADQVAKPLEDELATLSGVDTLQSNAAENLAVLIVTFQDGIDPDIAVQDVREKVTAIRANLPAEIEEPVFERIDPNQDPILTLAITSQGTQDSGELRRLLKDDIVPSIQRAEGVGSITLTGGLERQIDVNLDLNRLQALRILPARVSQAIAQAAVNLGVGDTLVGEQEFNLRTPSVFDTPADIATVGIPGTEYIIADIATVEDGHAEVETYARLNGEDTIIMDIRKQSGTNTVAVADNALAEIEQVFAAYPDLHYELIRNDAEDVRMNVNGALEEIILAVVFAMLVVWLFFRDLRNTLVTVLGLPVIMICTFAGMRLFGISINIVSLLALSVSVGLVIDDAIVVRENIFRHIERGEHPIRASSRGTAQVAASVLAMTLTIIVVFVPVAFTSGTVGIIFKSFGITVACGMAISIIEAFTMAPATAAYWSRELPAKPHHVPPGEEHLPEEAHEPLGRMEQVYARILAWTLRHRMVMVGVTALIIIGSVFVARQLQFSYLPYRERHQFGFAIEMPPGTPLESTNREAQQVEALLLADPAVASVLTRIGESDSVFDSGGSEQATFLVNIKEDATTPETQDRLRSQLSAFPGAAFSIPSYRYGTSTAVVRRPIQVELRGIGDLEELAPVADQLLAAFQGIEGLADIDTTYTPGKPELRYDLLQSRANDYNLTNQDLAVTMRTLVDGYTAATYRENGKDYDIVVRLRPGDRQSIADLDAVRLPLGGADVPISAIANLEVASSPTTIRRTDRQAEIVIGANNVNRNQNAVEADMQARMANIALPPGVRISFGGESEEQAESFRSLLLAMALSLTFVYMVLASQFGSFTQPLVIMLAMPLSVIGAFLGLVLTGLDLDIVAMIGMLMLIGLVVKNSILLVDFTNTLRRAGLAQHAALERAGALRLRPILMTSLAIVLASFPAALGMGEGAALRRGLATVVIGGVLASTLLTLLIVPTAYSLMEALTTGTSGLFRWLKRSRNPDATAANNTDAEHKDDALAQPDSHTGNGNGRSAAHSTSAMNNSSAPESAPTNGHHEEVPASR